MDNQNQDKKVSKKEKIIVFSTLVVAFVFIIAAIVYSKRDIKEMANNAFWSSFEIKIPAEEPEEEQAKTEKETTHQHAFGEWIIDQEATCTVPGQQKRSCLCGEFEVQEILAGHEWQEATCTEAGKCTVCGETQGTALGHDMKNASCTRCGKKTTVVLFENSIVKMTFNRAEKDAYDNKEENIYFDIENKTENTIKIYEEVISLNGYSFNDIVILYDSVAADSIGTIKLTIENYDFEKVNIYDISKMSGEFMVWDTDYICKIIFTNIPIE